MSVIILSVAALTGMGLLFGLGLAIAGEKFKVEVSQRLLDIQAALPGANCGGCGYAGCSAFAEAVDGGGAPPNGCPVGGAAVAKSVSEIMGVEVVLKERQAAFVKCMGGSSVSTFRYQYEGINSCTAIMHLAGGGSKSCEYGCLGGGSCREACQFGAISIVDGIAVVDNEKCTACGMCMRSCPKKLIEMVPYGKQTRVACNSHDNGKAVRANCKVGCIGCKLCVKACTYDAIQVNELLAAVDYAKCTQCGACVAKCPSKCVKGKATAI
jgi:Na+-translocating ferredoxin:NAD+ oxidoreductase RNF subunit RnfB